MSRQKRYAITQNLQTIDHGILDKTSVGEKSPAGEAPDAWTPLTRFSLSFDVSAAVFIVPIYPNAISRATCNL